MSANATGAADADSADAAKDAFEDQFPPLENSPARSQRRMRRSATVSSAPGQTKRPSLMEINAAEKVRIAELQSKLASVSAELRDAYTQLELNGSNVGGPVPLLVISDPGEDLDDEMAAILMCHLEESRFVDVVGVVANLRPSYDRARLMRGTLDSLDMYHVPVGIGTDGGSRVHKDTFSESAATYMPPQHSDRTLGLLPGRKLMRMEYEKAAPKSLSLLCISSLLDAALFLR